MRCEQDTQYVETRESTSERQRQLFFSFVWKTGSSARLGGWISTVTDQILKSFTTNQETAESSKLPNALGRRWNVHTPGLSRCCCCRCVPVCCWGVPKPSRFLRITREVTGRTESMRAKSAEWTRGVICHPFCFRRQLTNQVIVLGLG